MQESSPFKQHLRRPGRTSVSPDVVLLRDPMGIARHQPTAHRPWACFVGEKVTKFPVRQDQSWNMVHTSTPFSQVSLGSHGIQGHLPDIGDCSFKTYTCMLRNCSTMFYRDLKNHPDDCSGAFVRIKPCLKNVVSFCLGSLLNDDQLESVMKATLSQICSNGPLELPTSARPGVPGAVFPCAQNFTAVVANCEKPFYDKYRANKADSALCSSFATAKKCDLAATQSLCNFTSTVKEILAVNLDDYNPFCTSERDPGATGPGYCDAVVIPTLAPTKLPPDIGICPFKKYVCSVHACSAIFYRGLQKNPDDCSGLVLEFRSCMKRIVQICLGLAVHDHQLDRGGIKEEQLCAVGPLEIPGLPYRTAFFCGQNSSTEAKRCQQPFNEKFKTNKADPILCSSYTTAKNCMYNCTLFWPEEAWSEASQLGDYNPFCNSERDPGATGPGYCDGVAIITPTRASAAAGQSAKPAFLAFAVLLGAAVVDQFLKW